MSWAWPPFAGGGSLGSHRMDGGVSIGGAFAYSKQKVTQTSGGLSTSGSFVNSFGDNRVERSHLMTGGVTVGGAFIYNRKAWSVVEFPSAPTWTDEVGFNV